MIITKMMYVPWAMFGIVLVCTFTGYVSLTVGGTPDHVLLEKKVGALKGSTEANIAVEMLQVKLVEEYDTLEDLYKGIRAHEVDHGIINSDIVMYEQTTWNDGYSLNNQLVIIKTLPIESKVHVTKKGGWGLDEENDEFFKCLNRHVKNEVLRNVYNKYRRPIKITNLYYPDLIKEMVNPDIGSYQILFIVAFGLVILGFLYDFVDYTYHKFVKRKVDFISRRMQDELAIGSVRVSGREFNQLKKDILKLKNFMDDVADISKQNTVPSSEF
uniref:Uncharacterized protein n=3 Tax=Clytia hemisphaerica TaxID=252671 RepID=A0A7M5WI36_9CNID